MASKFRRELKNVVYNYSDAESKVREATSNDPWGPSSTLMSELSDYTYNVQAYALVMGMLWKRLNDHGKNWRHVYKALTVLEYLIKTGSDRVTQQCKENLFSIQTLKDFQFADKDGKDQGVNVREKAKSIVALLKDDKKLKDEKQRALQARERQGLSTSRDSPKPRETKAGSRTPEPAAKSTGAEGGGKGGATGGAGAVPKVEQARPSDTREEELQLQLALQISKQQAEEEEKMRTQEEESLKAALALSEAEANVDEEKSQESKPDEHSGDLLLDLSGTDPWAAKVVEAPPSYETVTSPRSDPWHTPTTTKKNTSEDVFASDSFGSWGDKQDSSTGKATQAADPWSSSASAATPAPAIATGGAGIPAGGGGGGQGQSNPFDLTTLGLGLGLDLPPVTDVPANDKSEQPKRVEDVFLGQNAALVDLNALLAAPPTAVNPNNPFLGGVTGRGGGGSPFAARPSNNPFEASKAPAPSLNQLASTNVNVADPLPPPLIPSNNPPPAQTSQAFNPFPTNEQSFNPFS